jgi:predicted transcriptional regulator
MEKEDLVSLTADIVAAHVANNNVAVGDLPTLIQNVHGALAALGEKPADAEPEGKKASVSMRASIKPDYLICMECGKKHKTLKRHLATAHGLSPAQYRADYGLPASYPMAAPNYAEQRRALALAVGLGRKAKGSGRRKSAPRKAGAAAGGRTKRQRRAKAG